jgi:hypothetical protein
MLNGVLQITHENFCCHVACIMGMPVGPWWTAIEQLRIHSLSGKYKGRTYIPNAVMEHTTPPTTLAVRLYFFGEFTLHTEASQID